MQYPLPDGNFIASAYQTMRDFCPVVYVVKFASRLPTTTSICSCGLHGPLDKHSHVRVRFHASYDRSAYSNGDCQNPAFMSGSNSVEIYGPSSQCFVGFASSYVCSWSFERFHDGFATVLSV